MPAAADLSPPWFWRGGFERPPRAEAPSACCDICGKKPKRIADAMLCCDVQLILKMDQAVRYHEAYLHAPPSHAPPRGRDAFLGAACRAATPATKVVGGIQDEGGRLGGRGRWCRHGEPHDDGDAATTSGRCDM